MKEIYCDRCGSAVTERDCGLGAEVLISAAYRENPMQAFTDIDLCQKCKKEFLKWFKDGEKSK